MDTETIGKIVGIAAALYPIGKGVAGWMTGKTSQMREDFRFAHDFLSSISGGRDSIHPFALEKGYQALAGSRRITIPEAEYLLSLEDSSNRLKDFVLGYSYVQHLNTSGENEISFRSKYMHRWARQWRTWAYFIAYAALALAAFSPFILAAPLQLSFSTVSISLLFTLPTLGTYSVMSLMAAIKIASAERLVTLQCKRQGSRPKRANTFLQRSAFGVR